MSVLKDHMAPPHSNSTTASLIDNKAKYSLSRIDLFKQHLSKSSELEAQSNLCIYTTGSYGRLEACEYSDIDLFFITDGQVPKTTKISKTLIDSHIITGCREMKLPEFSGDGEFLEIHNISNIYSELGSRKDDYSNFFTARMLLLLESKFVFNENFYNQTVQMTVEKYYKDFHEHYKDFKPIFLVNDVIRFWRTMCLNYEHNRNRKFDNEGLSNENIITKKNEVHIKNLKLKFSRKLTCYSFLMCVLYFKGVMTQEKVLDIISMTPLQRLEMLSEEHNLKSSINQLISLYFWFLEVTQVDKETQLNWIGNLDNRVDAFTKSVDFSKIMFEIMMKTENKDNLLYFLL